jgi:hypothetical protein
MFKDGEEIAYMVFDAHGADKITWFSCSRLLYSSYGDIVSTSQHHCSIDG